MNTESPVLNRAAMPSVMSVSALNNAVAQLLERQIPLLWVSGEISNFTRAASGHWYFTLKDAGAQVRAVMFRGRAMYAEFQPREGDKVEVRATVGLYAPRGDYQLTVEAIRRAGVGHLYESFLRIKATLEAEGLLAAERKRPLPAFVKRIGLITSPQAAALRDVLTTLKRRLPHAEVILYPAPVQGEGAAAKLALALATANDRAECDVIILCRGGGSIEDLWAFNDEMLARTIAHSDIPVISGVGHETDFTIADFVADLRAPTPTAAAELTGQPCEHWLTQLNQQQERLQRSWQRRFQQHQQTLDYLNRRLISPQAAIRQQQQTLQQWENRLKQVWQYRLNQRQQALTLLQQRWQAQRPDIRQAGQQLQQLQQRLQRAQHQQHQQRQTSLQQWQAQLEALNPQRTLERGYAILRDQQGRILRSPAALKPHQAYHIQLAEGSATAELASVQATLE